MKLSPEQEKVLIALHDGYTDPEKLAKQVCLSVPAIKKALSELQELGMVNGPKGLLDDCVEALKEMDDKLSPVDEGYSEHILLIASALSNANEEFLASELGYDKEFVSTVASRLKNAGIWVNGNLADDVRQSWMEDDISFFSDGSVACGFLEVVRGKGKDRRYKLTESGLKKGADLIKKMK